MDVTAIVIATSIPSALTGFCFWLIEQKLQNGRKNKRTRKKNAGRQRKSASGSGSSKSSFWCRESEQRSLSVKQPPRPCSGSRTLIVTGTCTPRWNMRQK